MAKIEVETGKVGPRPDAVVPLTAQPLRVFVNDGAQARFQAAEIPDVPKMSPINVAKIGEVAKVPQENKEGSGSKSGG